ncbi:hypothetical protein [Deinococcus cavernae]|uniref:hypothetical protein n=1 Tax=Deinococcus cavernae TaxID=2320857 RepID=UPI001F17A0A3|nr:hypothetical protein [Deinococcus cavernae]
MKRPVPTVTPDAVFAALRAAALTLDGVPACATSVTEGRFIVIATARPVLGTLHASAEWHYLSAWRVLQQRAGAFRS